jgi:hypothetical protein
MKKEEIAETEISGVEVELNTDCPFSIRLHIMVVRIVTSHVIIFTMYLVISCLRQST